MASFCTPIIVLVILAQLDFDLMSLVWNRESCYFQKHAKIYYNGAKRRYFIEDLNSRQGTSVNDEFVSVRYTATFTQFCIYDSSAFVTGKWILRTEVLLYFPSRQIFRKEQFARSNNWWIFDFLNQKVVDTCSISDKDATGAWRCVKIGRKAAERPSAHRFQYLQWMRTRFTRLWKNCHSW